MNSFSKDIKLLIFAQATSLVGGAILNFALALFVLELTGAVETFSIILATAAIPTALLAPMGGVIADRLDKKKMIVFLDFCKGLLGLILVTILFLGIEPVAWITIVMLFLSVSMTLYHPVITASIPALIDDERLVQANGAIQGINALAEFIAPVIAGLLMIHLPIEPILILGIALFWGSAIMELWIKIPFAKIESKSGILKTVVSDLKEGFSYISKENPKLLKLALSLAVFSAILNPLFMIGIPYITQAVFGLRQFHVGVAQGATAFAMLLGGLGIQLFKKWLSVKNSPIWMALMSFAILILYIALYFEGMIGFLIFTFGFMVILFISTCVNIFTFSLIQEESPSHLTGKVIGILIAIVGILTPLGLRGIGMMFGHFEENLNMLFLILFGILIISSSIAKIILREKSNS